MNNKITYENEFSKMSRTELNETIDFYDTVFIYCCEKYETNKSSYYESLNIVSSLEYNIHARKIKILKEHC